ncbi:MAG TPA: LuxR C-terminal-related transcriptional regulator [Ktedonobacteraceae bacterium]|jgi:DNA-binding NarL/FixJ family response regulator|nr:LuxR C-terminal-related transcriptional regulator [Ktedonobacteraceae bacterium]
MGKKVLVAEPREVIRTGLCTVFRNDVAVSEVCEVTTCEELKKSLSCLDPDLVVVSQALITDMNVLPPERSVLLIDEPDLDMLIYAYEHQARGYFSVNVAADLLRATLSSTEQTFLIDPTLFPWMLNLISKTRKRGNELQLLSPREREITALLAEGLDRSTIAKQLHISESTLKTHIKNIARKQEDARWPQKVFVYQRHLRRGKHQTQPISRGEGL